MILLSREIRFALVPPDRIPDGKPGNSWAGWPSTNLIVPQLALRCVLDGEIDPKTGYICNIKVIDDLLRQIVTRRLIPNYDVYQTAEELTRTIYREAAADWKHETKIVSLTLAITPFLRYAIHQGKTVLGKLDMNTTTSESDKIHLTQQFEFSAAHRLHCNELSASENVDLFGKCNNPEGHGHNYVVEVTVSNDVDSDRGQVIPLDRLESVVKRLVIDRLDHKHLNRDIEYFADVNPSVENIAVAIYQWLNGQFGSAKLESIKVFETPKTWAEYSG